jgi:hypothetical protein
LTPGGLILSTRGQREPHLLIGNYSAHQCQWQKTNDFSVCRDSEVRLRYRSFTARHDQIPDIGPSEGDLGRFAEVLQQSL